MRTLRFFVPSNRTTRTGRLRGLDGLNEIIHANRTNRYLGAIQERENLRNVMDHAYAAMKQERFEPIEGRAHVRIEIVEPHYKRDVGNVIAASKFLLDGITKPRGSKPGIGLIVDDSPKWCELEITVRVEPRTAGAWLEVSEAR